MKQLFRFFPKNLIEYLQDNDNFSNYPHNEEVGVLFVDISGFTKLSEELRKTKKRESGEFLANLISESFRTIIEIVNKWNGQIYKIIGDAFTVIFHKYSLSSSEIKQNMINCAVIIRDEIKNHEEVTYFDVSFKPLVKIGLSFGTVHFDILGSENTKLETLIIGDAVDNAVGAEKFADSLDILIHKSLYDIELDIVFKEINENFAVLLDSSAFQQKTYIANKIELSESKSYLLQKFLPYQISELLKTNYDFINEFKTSTVMFLNITKLIEDNPLVSLNKVYVGISNIINKYNGYINLFDYGDKGGMFLVLFGVPKAITSPDYLACLCAVELKKKYSKIAAGISKGTVFTGLIGADDRVHYTVIGDKVNLAARLMQKSLELDSILVENDVHERISSQFVSEFVNDFSLKGFSKRVPVFRVINSKEQIVSEKEINYKENLINRKKEFNQLKDFLLKSERKDISILITGEKGIGKSFILKSLNSFAAENDIKYYMYTCFPEKKYEPYYLLKKMILDLLNLRSDSNKNMIRERIDEFCCFYKKDNIKEGLKFFFHLSSEINIDNKSKKSIMLQSVIKFLESALPNDSVLEIEDIHLIDESSEEILYALSQEFKNSEKCIYLIFTEENHDTQIIGLCNHIKLKSFTFDESRYYLERKYKIKISNNELEQKIYKTSGGNPYYLNEIADFLLKTHAPDKNNEYVIIEERDFEIPDNISELISSKIDSLNNKEKRILKIASVFGNKFPRDILQFIMDKNLEKVKIEQTISNFADEDIAFIDTLNPDLEYAFKNYIFQETAYKSLLYKQRLSYHQEIVNLFSAKYTVSKNEEMLPVIAYHFYVLPFSKEKFLYTLLYIRYCQTNGSFEEAKIFSESLLGEELSSNKRKLIIMLYLNSLTVLGKYGEIIEQSEKEISSENSLLKEFLNLKKTEAFIHKGKSKDAYNLLKSSDFIHLHNIVKSLILKIQTIGLIGDVNELNSLIKLKNEIYKNIGFRVYQNKILLITAGAFKNLEEYLMSEQILLQIENWDKLPIIQKINYLKEIGVIYAKQGKIEDAEKTFIKGKELSESISHIKLTAQFNLFLGNINYTKNDFDNAVMFFQKAFKDFLLMNDKLNMANIEINTGNIYLVNNNYNKAEDCFLKALDLVGRSEYENLEALIYEDLGDLYFKMGEIKSSEEKYEQALNLYKKTYNKRGEAHIYGNLANIVYEKGGSSETQINLYEKQIDICREIKDYLGLAKAYNNLGLTYMDENKLDSANEFLLEADSMYRKIGDKNGYFWTEVFLYQILLFKKGNDKIDYPFLLVLLIYIHEIELYEFVLLNKEISENFSYRELTAFILLLFVFYINRTIKVSELEKKVSRIMHLNTSFSAASVINGKKKKIAAKMLEEHCINRNFDINDNRKIVIKIKQKNTFYVGFDPEEMSLLFIFWDFSENMLETISSKCSENDIFIGFTYDDLTDLKKEIDIKNALFIGIPEEDSDFYLIYSYYEMKDSEVLSNLRKFGINSSDVFILCGNSIDNKSIKETRFINHSLQKLKEYFDNVESLFKDLNLNENNEDLEYNSVFYHCISILIKNLRKDIDDFGIDKKQFIEVLTHKFSESEIIYKMEDEYYAELSIKSDKDELKDLIQKLKNGYGERLEGLYPLGYLDLCFKTN